jgi:hypothetical protein
MDGNSAMAKKIINSLPVGERSVRGSVCGRDRGKQINNIQIIIIRGLTILGKKS